MIWAQDANRGIGIGGNMPWHLPEDYAHFKRTTLGCPVISGRVSYQALPPKFRPLPGRRNIVITHDAQSSAALQIQSEGAEVLDLAQAKALVARLRAAPGPDVFIIGGASIYQEFIDCADELIVTQIDAKFPADTFAPEIPPSFASPVESPWEQAGNGLKWRVVRYLR